ncbi:NADP-dependent oxidoreductase domain-containing protein [Chlamydoabsidia padenii]|nr:NADP-dependent oxidoreductase domain-containing protein [Chlamydoabsidia padenii]
MEYRYLGSSGIKVSAIGLGTWITFAAQINSETSTECMRVAFENGVNFFDVAESHSDKVDKHK